jgi:deoxyhypusine synthase
MSDAASSDVPPPPAVADVTKAIGAGPNTALIAAALKAIEEQPENAGGVGPLPQIVIDAVLASSAPGSIAADTPVCKGVDWSKGAETSLNDIMAGYLTSGFQATNLGLAIDEVKRMRAWRLSDVPVGETDDETTADPEYRENVKAKIFLSFTSNMISCGTRETIVQLVKHKLVDVVTTTAGGIEEDLMKCLAPTYMGDFALKGRNLRLKGVNRIGNLLVPNDNYCKLEDFLAPLLETMTDEQVNDKTVWTPSTAIERMGHEIDNEESVLYWCAKNGIPVFCPALTDGSIGDMIYFHSYKRPEFILDIARDVRRINDEAVSARREK